MMKKRAVLAVLLCVSLVLLLHASTQKVNISWSGYIDASGLTTFLIPGSSSSGQALVNSSGQIGGKAITGSGTLATISGSFTDNDCTKYQASTQSIVTAGAPCGSGGGGGSVGTPSLGGTGWTTVDRLGGGRCATGNVSLAGGTFTYPGGTVSATAAALQEIPLFSGLNGDMRYDHVQVSIVTQFTQGASVTDVQAGVGRSGSSSTDNEMFQNFSLFQVANTFGFDRPQPPVIGTANTYSLALSLRTVGGNVSNLTAGNVLVELCGYSIN